MKINPIFKGGCIKPIPNPTVKKQPIPPKPENVEEIRIIKEIKIKKEEVKEKKIDKQA